MSILWVPRIQNLGMQRPFSFFSLGSATETESFPGRLRAAAIGPAPHAAAPFVTEHFRGIVSLIWGWQWVSDSCGDTTQALEHVVPRGHAREGKLKSVKHNHDHIPSHSIRRMLLHRKWWRACRQIQQCLVKATDQHSWDREGLSAAHSSEPHSTGCPEDFQIWRKMLRSNERVRQSPPMTQRYHLTLRNIDPRWKSALCLFSVMYYFATLHLNLAFTDPVQKHCNYSISQLFLTFFPYIRFKPFFSPFLLIGTKPHSLQDIMQHTHTHHCSKTASESICLMFSTPPL